MLTDNNTVPADMSHRRGAPSVNKECVVRRKWYAEAQEKEFKGNDSSSSDDEAQVVHVTEEEISAAAGRKTGEEKHDNEVLDDAKETKKVSSRPPSTFTNFASMLGAESRQGMYSLVNLIFYNNLSKLIQQPHGKNTHSR